LVMAIMTTNSVCNIACRPAQSNSTNLTHSRFSVLIIVSAIFGGLCLAVVVVAAVYLVFRYYKHRYYSYETINGSDTRP